MQQAVLRLPKNHRATLSLLVTAIAVLAAAATCVALFTSGGPGSFEFTSIHGKQVLIFGKGLYRNMSADVAPQGLAQDVVTLFIGIPLLAGSLIGTRRGSLRAGLLLSGTLGYFMVTYLFYLMMGMFNMLFLVYVLLLGCSFFGFLILFGAVRRQVTPDVLSGGFPRKFIGTFLICNAALITTLWLSVIVPPLLRSEIPVEVQHYTTLVVQGLDLALLLPLCFVAGSGMLRAQPWAYSVAAVYSFFLALLMCALSAKIVAMGLLGQNIMPAVIIIPVMNILAIVCCALWLRHIRSH